MSEAYAQLESGTARSQREPSMWQRLEHIRLPLLMVVGFLSLAACLSATSGSTAVAPATPIAANLIMAAGEDNGAPEDKSMYPCVSRDCTMVAGNMLNQMDRKTDPCDDAYQHTCGRFMETFELPDDETTWTLSFNDINKRNRNTLKQLLEDAKTDANADQWDQMLAALHSNCIDTEKLDREGAQPLLDLLNDELPWLLRSHQDLQDEAKFMEASPAKRGKLTAERLAAFHLAGLSGFFGFSIYQNTKNPEKHNTMYIAQSGLGLEYGYYNRDDAVSAKVLASYESHMTRLFDLLDAATGPKTGNPSSAERAKAVLQLEFDMRALFLSPIEQRDPVKTTNNMTFAMVKQLTGEQLALDAYMRPFNAMVKEENRVNEETELIVRSPAYMTNIAALLAKADWAVVHDYLLVRALRSFGSALSSEWREEFERYSFERSGAKTAPRWKTCLAQTKGMMSWVLARKFVLKAFDAKRKSLSESILTEVRKAFREQIKEVKWMDDETRAKALRKEELMGQKIGYPDWLVDAAQAETYFVNFYGQPDVEAVKKSWLAGSVHLDRASTRHSLSELGEPADRAMWGMDPATVNAYYSPPMNEIVFPASILQPPFLYMPDEAAQRMEVVAFTALNFGAYGAVVGHEITHGFDDKGSQYDPSGKIENWWSKASREAFDKATQCVDDQYSAFAIPDGTHVKGKLTLGENIADNGGFRTAYRALKAVLTPEELASKPFPGLNMTASQLFMLSFSQVWCNKSTPETLRSRVESDPHSPGMFRVQGVLANSPQFAADFGCKAGQKLNPKDSDRCIVW